MAVASLLDLNRCKAAELEAVQDIIGDIAGKDIDPSVVADDVRLAQEANVDVLKFLKAQSGDLSDDGKWLAISTIRRIVERVSPLMTHERDRFVEYGKAMGLRKKHIDEFLDTPLG